MAELLQADFWAEVCQASSDHFTDGNTLKALDLYNLRPHLVNKKLGGSEILDFFNADLVDLVTKLMSPEYKFVGDSCLTDFQKFQKSEGLVQKESVHSYVRLLISKDGSFGDKWEVVHFDYNKKECYFLSADYFFGGLDTSRSPPYKISFGTTSLSLHIPKNFVTSRTVSWLKETLFTKIVEWAKTDLQQSAVPSLSLISTTLYLGTYNRLKNKYADELCKNWTECTDPKKFVYEDLAIAAYLLNLWGDRQVRFVDLGCGNGLLVYILTQEGHRGLGIDIRARKIWSTFPETVELKECPIQPSHDYLFPNSDWIIGNHSDELTPWIPIISARSSYTSSFFLLPCCSYNLDGSKYMRACSSKSQYSDYMGFVCGLCRECGFDVEVDRLRIPSTKRTCIVGRNRVYPEENFPEFDSRILDLVRRLTNSRKDGLLENNLWVDNFSLREPIEKVRNCTQIDRGLVEEIVEITCSMILHNRDDSVLREGTWNDGDPVELCEIIKALSAGQLKCLKNECGGLQTLLRNNHHIFLVLKGEVKFRKPIAKKPGDVKTWKKRPCWFYYNHPDSCPLEESQCSFRH